MRKDRRGSEGTERLNDKVESENVVRRHYLFCAVRKECFPRQSAVIEDQWKINATSAHDQTIRLRWESRRGTEF